MQPRKYGNGTPKTRFILKEILDVAGDRSNHWDVAALYDTTKRRRITRKTAPICESPSLPAVASGSTDPKPEVSPDILDMDNTVGQYIRDVGNPMARDLWPMLKKKGHRHTRAQIRI